MYLIKIRYSNILSSES